MYWGSTPQPAVADAKQYLERGEDVDERKTKFIEVLTMMHAKIGQDFVNEKDPIARCELAKGYLKIGDYLSKY